MVKSFFRNKHHFLSYNEMKERRVKMKQIISFQKEIVFRTMIGEITSISLEHTLAFENENTIRGDFIVSGTYKMTEASQLEETFDHHLPVDITVDERYDMSHSKLEIDDFYYEIINDEILKVNIDVLLDGVEKPVEEEKKPEVSLEEKVIKSHIEKEPEEVELVRKEVTSEIELRDQNTEMLDNKIELLQDTEPKVVELPLEEEMVEKVSSEEPVIKLEKKKEKVIEVVPSTEIETSPSLNSIFSAFKDTDETFSTYSIYIVRENDTLDKILDRYHTTKEDLENYNNLSDLTLGMKLIIPTSVQKDG